MPGNVILPKLHSNLYKKLSYFCPDASLLCTALSVTFCCPHFALSPIFFSFPPNDKKAYLISSDCSYCSFLLASLSLQWSFCPNKSVTSKEAINSSTSPCFSAKFRVANFLTTCEGCVSLFRHYNNEINTILFQFAFCYPGIILRCHPSCNV